MTTSYGQIDGVFGNDVSICGVNLKKLWCEFGCSPKVNGFVHGLGYKTLSIAGINTTFTELGFAVEENMACTIF